MLSEHPLKQWTSPVRAVLWAPKSALCQAFTRLDQTLIWDSAMKIVFMAGIGQCLLSQAAAK